MCAIHYEGFKAAANAGILLLILSAQSSMAGFTAQASTCCKLGDAMVRLPRAAQCDLKFNQAGRTSFINSLTQPLWKNNNIHLKISWCLNVGLQEEEHGFSSTPLIFYLKTHNYFTSVGENSVSSKSKKVQPFVRPLLQTKNKRLCFTQVFSSASSFV